MAAKFVRKVLEEGQSIDCKTCGCPLFAGEAFVYGDKLTDRGYVIAVGCSVDCCRAALDAAEDRVELHAYRTVPCEP